MIYDALGMLSDNQSLAGMTPGVVQSTNWMDFGEATYRDKLGSGGASFTVSPDIAAGEPLYIAFRVNTGFSHGDAAAQFRAIVYMDDSNPPASASGQAHYNAGTEAINLIGAAFSTRLQAGATFHIALSSVMGGYNALGNSNILAPDYSQGMRYLRVAYQLSGTAGNMVTGAISAYLTRDSHAIGAVGPGSTKFIGGIYPASTVS